jgi:lipopolysaccharide/colanic/teichoic acid biosynthesis glycosyltransferase
MRRVFDIVLAMTALVVSSPLFLLCIFITYWQMGRPVFYKQERLGQGGSIFKVWKFRTMLNNARRIVNSSPELASLYAKNYKINPAFLVPSWGKIMRKTSLDELPQLINVLEGDLAIIGPRPIVPEEIAKYGQYDRKLLSVKPGLTGLWQVSGRNKIEYPERIFYDMYYIDHQSFALDVKILAKTIIVLLTMDGAS